jgi:hypothetical protein
MKNLKLSIIIVNYNTSTLLKECISSIRKSTKPIPFEIIVVDNASTDKSDKYLSSLSSEKQIKVIKNKKNLGFSKANNQGIKIAEGEFILLLNSDTLINDNIFPKLFEWLDVNKQAGIVSCKLKNSDGTIQATGGYFPTLSKVATWMLFFDDLPLLNKLLKPFHPKAEFYPNTDFQLDWVTGAFFLIRREVIDKIGYLDEDYFMYVEDLDYCYRAKKEGWEVWYLPFVSIIHLGGASSTKAYPLISEYENIKLFYKKNLPVWQYQILIFLLKMGAVLRIIVFSLFSAERSKIYAQVYKKV